MSYARVNWDGWAKQNALAYQPKKPVKTSDAQKVKRNSGQLHPKARLSDREVELLRQMRETEGWSYGQLAVKFEISKYSVVRICRYRTR